MQTTFNHRLSFWINTDNITCCKNRKCVCTAEVAASQLQTYCTSLYEEPSNHSIEFLQKLSQRVSTLSRFSKEIIDKCQHMIGLFQSSLENKSWTYNLFNKRFAGRPIFPLKMALTRHSFKDDPNKIFYDWRPQTGELVCYYLDHLDSSSSISFNPSSTSALEIFRRLDEFRAYHSSLVILRNPRYPLSLWNEKNNENDKIQILYNQMHYCLLLPEEDKPVLFKSKQSDEQVWQSIETFPRFFVKAFEEFTLRRALSTMQSHLPPNFEMIRYVTHSNDVKIHTTYQLLLNADFKSEMAIWTFEFYFLNILKHEYFSWKTTIVENPPKESDFVRVVERFLIEREKKVVDWLKSRFGEMLVEKKVFKWSPFPTYKVVYDAATLAERQTVLYCYIDSDDRYMEMPLEFPINEATFAQYELLRDYHHFRKTILTNSISRKINIEWYFDKKLPGELKYGVVRVAPQADLVYYDYLDLDGKLLSYIVSKIDFVEHVTRRHLSMQIFPYIQQLNSYFKDSFIGVAGISDKDAPYVIYMKGSENGYMCDFKMSHPIVEKRTIELQAATLEGLKEAIRLKLADHLVELQTTLSCFFDIPCLLAHEVSSHNLAILYSLRDFSPIVRNKQGFTHVIDLPETFKFEPTDVADLMIYMYAIQAYIEREDNYLTETLHRFNITLDVDFVPQVSFTHPYKEEQVTVTSAFNKIEADLFDAHEKLTQLLLQKKIIEKFKPTDAFWKKTYVAESVPTLLLDGDLPVLLQLFDAEKDLKDRGNLANMVKVLSENRTHNGAPANAEERKKLYDNMKCYLSHVIVALGTCDKGLRREILSLLTIASVNCTGRWCAEIMQHYNTLMGKNPSQLFDRCLAIFDRFKLGIVEKLTGGQRDNTPHKYVAVCRLLAEHGVAIPGGALAGYDDVYRNLAVGLKNSYKIFLSEANAYDLALVIKDNLNADLAVVNNKIAAEIISILQDHCAELPESKAALEQIETNYIARKALIQAAPELEAGYIEHYIEKGRIALGKGLKECPSLPTQYGQLQVEVYKKYLQELEDIDLEEREVYARALNHARNQFTNSIKALYHELLSDEAALKQQALKGYLNKKVEELKWLEWKNDDTVIQLSLDGALALLTQLNFLQKVEPL